MKKETFAGMNGFVWWIGVVESRKDPLNIGRCQIRILGWHSEDLTMIPTEDLPWSHPMLPVNNSKSFKTPVEGDWVIGFFLDGKSGQSPVYMGVLPGIPQSAASQEELPPNKGFQDIRDGTELQLAPTLPKKTDMPPDGTGATTTNQKSPRYPSTEGQPSVPNLAVNSPQFPPESIALREANTVADIAGPKTKSLATDLAAAASGAAEAVGNLATDALTQIKSMMPDLTSITDSVSTDGKSLLATAQEAATSAQNVAQGAINTVTSAAKEASDAAMAQIATIKNNIQSLQDSAVAEAKKVAEMQAASAGSSVSSLSAATSSIAGKIAESLSSITPAAISTKSPVVLDNSIPKVVVPPTTTYNKILPNAIPTDVPLNQSGSAQEKSKANAIDVYKKLIVSLYDQLSSAISSAKTNQDILTNVSPLKSQWTQAKAQTSQIASTYNDPTIQTDLDAWSKPYADKLNAQGREKNQQLGNVTS